MIVVLFLQTVLPGFLLLGALLCMVTFRLQSQLRAYTLSSFSLALLTAVIAYEGGLTHLYVFALVTFLLKCVLIPFFIRSAAQWSHASLRIQSSVRPAPSYYIAGIILLLMVFTVRTLPFFNQQTMPFLPYVSVSLVFLGFAIMILRRNIFAQMIGFLVLENGITVFSIATIGSLPLLLEITIFSTVMVGVLLMALLSRHIRGLYGTEDTSSLTELID
jgi:hydrogenase-4 component E